MPIDEEAELARREEEWKCLSFDAGGQDGVVRTGISQAFWFDPTPVDGGAIRGFAPAKYDFDDGRGEAEVFWLDGLLRGGLRFPAYKKEGSRRAVTMLLSGPPGTGKSISRPNYACVGRRDGHKGSTPATRPPRRRPPGWLIMPPRFSERVSTASSITRVCPKARGAGAEEYTSERFSLPKSKKKEVMLI